MKITKPSAPKFSLASLIAIGNAGTALCLSEPPEGSPVDGTPFTATFRSFKASGIDPVEVGSLHAKGESCGMAEWDAALFVSHRGTPVRVLSVGAALKSGVIAAHKMLLRRDGAEREVTVYLAKGQTPGMRQPKFVACPDTLTGRVESKLVSEPGGGPARNAGYVGHLVPLAFKGAKPAPAPVASVPAKVSPVAPKASKSPAPVKSPAPAVKPSPKAPKAPAK